MIFWQLNIKLSDIQMNELLQMLASWHTDGCYPILTLMLLSWLNLHVQVLCTYLLS